MRWWLRIILTLVLAPILWRLVAGYIAVNAGGSAMDIARGSAVVLGEVYVAYTLPALAIVILLLVPADIVLRRVGVAILIVGVAPLLACLVPLVLARYGIGQDNGGMLGLAFAYGLVWGLTIREPRQTRGAAMTADASR